VLSRNGPEPPPSNFEGPHPCPSAVLRSPVARRTFYTRLVRGVPLMKCKLHSCSAACARRAAHEAVAPCLARRPSIPYSSPASSRAPVVACSRPSAALGCVDTDEFVCSRSAGLLQIHPVPLSAVRGSRSPRSVTSLVIHRNGIQYAPRALGRGLLP
jgi:hypothetical protein